MGFGDRQLNEPCGVCVDDQGRIVVCDRNNNRVTTYWWDKGEQWDVVLDPESSPLCLSMTPDCKHMVVGIFDSTTFKFFSHV